MPAAAASRQPAHDACRSRPLSARRTARCIPARGAIKPRLLTTLWRLCRPIRFKRMEKAPPHHGRPASRRPQQRKQTGDATAPPSPPRRALAETEPRKWGTRPKKGCPDRSFAPPPARHDSLFCLQQPQPGHAPPPPAPPARAGEGAAAPAAIAMRRRRRGPRPAARETVERAPERKDTTNGITTPGGLGLLKESEGEGAQRRRRGPAETAGPAGQAARGAAPLRRPPAPHSKHLGTDGRAAETGGDERLTLPLRSPRAAAAAAPRRVCALARPPPAQSDAPPPPP